MKFALEIRFTIRLKWLLIPVLLTLLPFFLNGQEPDTIKIQEATEGEQEIEEETEDTLSWETSRVTRHFQIGASAGVGSLFGELDNDLNVSIAQRLGGQLFINYGITPSLMVGIAFVHGRVYGQIRSSASDPLFTNLNVKTTLFAPQLRATWHFGGLYRNQMPGAFQPWVFAGIEPLFFNPYSDLTTAEGKPYYYWSDGSIRDMPELPDNISKATYLQRDYYYESFLRDANLDGFGTYKGYTLAIPVGLGLDINLNETLTLSLGGSFHYTFTDHLDDIIHHSGALDPTRAIGNKWKDAFVLFNAGITFKYYETEPIEYKSLNIPPPPAAFLPLDFYPYDLNSDRIIQREEVLAAIQMLFNEEEGADPEIISLLVDFYNIQAAAQDRIRY